MKINPQRISGFSLQYVRNFFFRFVGICIKRVIYHSGKNACDFICYIKYALWVIFNALSNELSLKNVVSNTKRM